MTVLVRADAEVGDRGQDAVVEAGRRVLQLPVGQEAEDLAAQATGSHAGGEHPFGCAGDRDRPIERERRRRVGDRRRVGGGAPRSTRARPAARSPRHASRSLPRRAPSRSCGQRAAGAARVRPPTSRRRAAAGREPSPARPARRRSCRRRASARPRNGSSAGAAPGRRAGPRPGRPARGAVGEPASDGAGTTRATASTTARALRRRRRFGKRRTSVGRQAGCHLEGTLRRMEGRDHRPMVPAPTSTEGCGVVACVPVRSPRDGPRR